MKAIALYLVLAAVAATVPLASEAKIKTFDLNIPRQTLDQALSEFSRVTGLQVARMSDQGPMVGLVGPLRGEFAAKDALESLLRGTGLEFGFINERMVTIYAAGSSTRTDAPTAATGEDHAAQTDSSAFWDRFRLAQVDQGTPTGISSLEKKAGQGADQSSEKLEEVVVTAQKREERLIDVPISIVALGAEELQRRELTSLDDLQFAVPGMAITTDGSTENKIVLRGVSNLEGISPLVGVYIDEADVTNGAGSQINPNTYDLERVEVLRGPQGTLYGEGSAGGTIRFITKSPVLDRFGMTANVTSLFTQAGSPGERINTAINVPLIDQQLGVRIVGTFNREGGWIDQPAAGLKDINGQDLTNVRIKGLWKPSPLFSASFMAEFYRNDRSTGTSEDAAGNFTQVLNLTTTPKASEDHDIYNLTLAYEFPVVKILSATTYLREKFEGRNVGYVNPTGPSGTTPPYHLLYPDMLRNDDAWIEELRLSSIGSGPWQWTVGALYRRYKDFNDTSGFYFGQLGPPGTPLPAPFPLDVYGTLFKSRSVFGDVSYTWWQRLTLGLGVRSFHEEQGYSQTYDVGDGPTTVALSGTFHSVDPRIYAQYKLSRDINIYASAAKGFRSGGFNISPTQPTFAPEDIRTYELGSKMSLFEGRLRADTAVFYTDYKDYVILGFANVTDLFAADVNAGNARLKGVEWDLVWRPSHQWSLGINGNYVDSRFTKINATSTAYEVGDPLDFVPKYQVTSAVERDFSWKGRQISMRLDYTRRGRETQRNRSLGPWFYGESDVINLLGYYMNLQWSQNLSFNLFGQNLLNDRGLIAPDLVSSARSRPRTYGLGFDISY